MTTTLFSGIPREVIEFLAELEANNRRDWFNERKPFFKEVVESALRDFVAATSDALRRGGIPLRADLRSSVFRIYRDTRFSPDKRPFKTNLGVVFDRAAKKGASGVLYVHAQPRSSFAALAFYQPDQKALTKLREHLVDEERAFLRIVSDLQREGLSIESDEVLKRLPRGFEEFAERAIAPYLKMKSLLIHLALTNKEICAANLPDRLAAFVQTGLPFLHFGWSALER